jgi:hypothetical protein
MKPLTGLNSNGWLPALHSNISLGWTLLTVANTLAYNDTAKCCHNFFIFQAPGACTIKRFMTVIVAVS